MHRKYFSFFTAVVLILFAWVVYMHQHQLWYIFQDNWFMTVTMVIGSFVAGASSEGGGAIAYPVMTILFNIEPDVARNFSFAIQSIGMSFAAIWIFLSGINIEKNYLLLAGTGGFAGILLGSFFVAPYVSPGYAKMMFVSFWLSFGLALFVVNFIRKKPSLDKLPELNGKQKTELIGIGLIGGIFSSVFGNGIDICTFSYVVMKYGLSEKIATPASVILMASNAIVGFVLHLFILNTFNTEAINYWLVCIPVVIFGAPLGAYVVNRLGRKTIATLLILIILVQFFTALFVIKPGMQLMVFSLSIFLFGLFLFFVLTRQSNGIKS